MLRRVGLLLLSLVGVLAAVLGFLAYDATRPGPRSVRLARSGPPSRSEQRQARQTAQRLETQIEEAARPETAAAAKTFELRISEADLNEMIHGLPDVRKSLHSQKIEELTLDFVPGRLVAHARVPVYGQVQARVSVTGEITAKDGQLAYRSESMQVGMLPAPAALRRELDRHLGAAVKQMGEGLGGRLDEVSIDDEALVVRGERPR